MRIVDINFQKPANLLIAALQKYCSEIIAEPLLHGIGSLKDVEKRIWNYAKTLQDKFPKCSLDNLEVIAHSNQTQEYYNLLYRGEKSMIFIFARPDQYESAFREYDASQKVKTNPNNP